MVSTITALSYLIAFGVTGLLWYWLKRFGKVSRTWVAIDSTETALVKAAFRAYERSHPRPRRSGTTLYAGRLIGPDGLVVTDRGVYGKFCVGREGKPRFVPVQEVSGIYPVTFEMPSSIPTGLTTSPRSWKGLQIEAESGLVLVVDSRKHDFGAVVAALERALGDRWKTVYQGQETLWSSILRGDAYIHAMVRAARGGPTRAPPGPAWMPPPQYAPPTAAAGAPLAPGAPRLPPAFGSPPAAAPFMTAHVAGPVAPGKGKLLLEESPEERRKRGRSMLKGAVVLGAITAVSLAAFPVFTSLGRFVATLAVIPLLVALFCGVFTVVFLYASRVTTPMRVFENGFEVPHYLSGRVFFFSFGELDSLAERRNFIDGETYLFRTKQGQFFAFRKGIKGMPEAIESIRVKIGRPEYLIKLPESEQPTSGSRRLEYMFYCIALALGGVGALIGVVLVYGDEPFATQVAGLGLLLPPFGMIVVTYMAYSIRKFEKFVPSRPDVRLPAAFVVGLVVYFFISLAVFSGGPASTPQPTAIQLEPTPSASILAAATYDGAVLLLNGSVLVATGERMEWVNSTVSMNLAAKGEFGIFVQPGGTLVLENTTLRAAHPPFNYTFEVLGAMEIRNSTVSGLWGDAVNKNYNGGLEIYSDAVVIDHANIVGGDSNALLIRNSSPRVSNSAVHGGHDDCIEARNTSLVLLNTRVADCSWGLWALEGSKVTVENCIFQGNTYGVYLESATGTLSNNSFFYNDQAAISYSEDDAAPVLTGNTYGNNGVRVYVRSGLPIVEICSAVILGMGVACLAVLAKVHREGRLKEERKKLGASLPPELL